MKNEQNQTILAGKVPAGYQQTEVGIIPEDWRVTKLKEVTSLVSSGKTSTKNKGIYPLYGSTGIIGSCKVAEYDGDAILVARVGANAGSLNIVSGQYGVSDNTIIIQSKGCFNIRYLSGFLELKKLNELVFGSGQPLITGSQIKNVTLLYPPLKEQTAIAEALSDVDSLLVSLEKLIEKKRAIKTGTMQQLLTGKKRLPAFAQREDGTLKGYKMTELGEIPEDWEVVKLGDIGNVVTGGTPPTQNQNYWNGNFAWITPSDITSKKDIFTGERKLTDKGLNQLRVLPKDTLLVTCIASIGKNAILRERGGCNQQINAIIPNKNIDVDYLYYLMEISKPRLLLSAGTTATMIISKQTFEDIKFAFPNIEEQTAIAEILSDMDAEIEALEAKCAKTEEIKQGMMQELLTGRTRLV